LLPRWCGAIESSDTLLETEELILSKMCHRTHLDQEQESNKVVSSMRFCDERKLYEVVYRTQYQRILYRLKEKEKHKKKGKW
jgi:hypothetical protein